MPTSRSRNRKHQSKRKHTHDHNHDHVPVPLTLPMKLQLSRELNCSLDELESTLTKLTGDANSSFKLDGKGNLVRNLKPGETAAEFTRRTQQHAAQQEITKDGDPAGAILWLLTDMTEHEPITIFTDEMFAKYLNIDIALVSRGINRALSLGYCKRYWDAENQVPLYVRADDPLNHRVRQHYAELPHN